MYAIFILTAKVHCVADTESIDKQQYVQEHTDLLPFNIIPRHTERTIVEALHGNEEDFIQDMIAFAMVSKSSSLFSIDTCCFVLFSLSVVL
jgi:hypothetical protein